MGFREPPCMKASDPSGVTKHPSKRSPCTRPGFITKALNAVNGRRAAPLGPTQVG